jgi:transcriptional regulator with XRE-family HTH domain
MAFFWWDRYGPFSPSSTIQGYPEPHEVFLEYFRRSGMGRAELAKGLGVQDKMAYHIEKYGTSLNSLARLRQLCSLLAIPAVLFGLAERPEPSSCWRTLGYDWPAGDDGFPVPGQVVRHFRQSKDWYQRDLAKALGLSEVTVRHMENYDHNLDSLSRRQAIAFVLSMPAAARVFLGLDASHVSLPGAPATLKAQAPRLSLEDIHTTQEQLWTGYYAGANSQAGVLQARELSDQIGNILPQVGEAERSQWLAAQSLLWQWVTNATRETGDPKVVLSRARRAFEMAKQAGIPDLVATARMRQMETAYVLQREESAVAYAHVLVTTTAPDLVVNATRAIACARVLACTAHDQEDRSLVLGLLEQAVHFGGANYGLHYDATTYALRQAETLINLAQHAVDRRQLLGQAKALLDGIDGPLSKLRLVGVRTAQAQVAVGVGEYELAAVCANEAVSVGKEIATTTHLPAITLVYHALRQTTYANEPLTARLGLSLFQLHQF